MKIAVTKVKKSLITLSNGHRKTISYVNFGIVKLFAKLSSIYKNGLLGLFKDLSE